MPYIMVDIESDGPIPGDYSMICFGAVVVEPELKRTFYGKLRPVSVKLLPAALAVSGFSYDECLESRYPYALAKTGDHASTDLGIARGNFVHHHRSN